MRRIRLALIAVTLAVSGCGSDDDDGPSGEATGPQTTPTAASELEGTWRTAPISLADTVRTIRGAGLGRHVDQYEKNAPLPGDPVSLELEIGDGTWDLYGVVSGGGREEIDYDADLKIDGDTARVSHEGDSNTYRWSVRGGKLDLEWLDTTYPPNSGVPEEVYQRALYETASFKRAE